MEFFFYISSILVTVLSFFQIKSFLSDFDYTQKTVGELKAKIDFLEIRLQELEHKHANQ